MPSLFDHTNHEIYIVSCAMNNRRYGFIATWVIPLTLTGQTRKFAIAVSKLNASYQPLLTTKHLGLQMLVQGDEDLVWLFGGTSSKNGDKYHKLKCIDHKLPLIDGSFGYIEASIENTIDLGDRAMVIAITKTCVINDQKKPPLTMSYLKQVLPDKVLVKLKNRKIELAKQSLELIKSLS